MTQEDRRPKNRRREELAAELKKLPAQRLIVLQQLRRRLPAAQHLPGELGGAALRGRVVGERGHR